ncbi:HNH endonuclease [Nocardia brasiliensis]|uniref:HNH endonuclease n=1 Tax=Nocardia brasiliensis TaxID=37326 RepID=A0A6G9Y0R4_NOCBR|nr:HNH endonuclease signature motif containing protein [Nocardia brasiliensis]QIS06795.1 HNH endonuclease [Nocardia brasiliensis]
MGVAAKLGDPRLPERFWDKVAVVRHGRWRCWDWRASTYRGYAEFWYDGRMRRGYRVAYTALIGPVPAGLVLDHRCRNRRCCNPSHLEPVTSRENTLRGSGPTAINARKRACARGHRYTTANTYRRGGYRYCRQCIVINARNRQRKRAAP